MKLVVDIGNTCAKVAAFSGDEMLKLSVGPNDKADAISEVCAEYAPTSCVVSTVIPLNDEVNSALTALHVPLLWLSGTTPVPVRTMYTTPETLGPDRIAAVVGASYIHPGRNMLVIDAGTCITYEFVDSDGCYHGGNISPGLQMRLKALHHYTGKLPMVDADGELPGWGNSTETAIRAGVFRGIEHEMAGYIKELRQKYSDLLVFLTGGDKFSFDETIKNIIFADRFLVLKGLNRILDYNNGRIQTDSLRTAPRYSRDCSSPK
jgi:type III pantothenate kinase